MKIKRLTDNDASVELGFDYPDIATVHESELAALEEQESELRKTLARREEQLREMCNNTRYWIRVYASMVPGAKHREHVDYIKTQRILAAIGEENSE